MGNTTKRKKAYRAFCREQVVKGLINMPDGTWFRADLGRAMHRDQWHGYKLGNTKKPRKGAKAKVE